MYKQGITLQSIVAYVFVFCKHISQTSMFVKVQNKI